ncbi:unnamed protein product [Ascophyllum nodosum]
MTSFQTALDFNLPKGDQFLVNSRGQRLHLRAFLPVSGDPKAVIFWFHGYAAHVNGPTFQKFTKGITAKGFVVVALDQHGHGYSDGDRVLIRNYHHLLDDAIGVLDVITQGKEDGEQGVLGIGADVRRTLSKLPFFLSGQSLGGAVSLLMALRLRADAARTGAASRLLGVMTNCPAIIAKPPPKPVLMILKYIIAPIFPKTQVPSFLDTVSVPELTWTTEESMKMGALDKIDQPGGLGWPGNMRLGTGSQLVDMVNTLESRLTEVDFPFLVLHDPEDGVVKFEGTRKLMKSNTTPEETPRGRELKEMSGKKHDLLSNATEDMLEAYVDWADARLELYNRETT